MDGLHDDVIMSDVTSSNVLGSTAGTEVKPESMMAENVTSDGYNPKNVPNGINESGCSGAEGIESSGAALNVKDKYDGSKVKAVAPAKTVSDKIKKQLFQNILKDLEYSKMFYYSFLRSLQEDNVKEEQYKRKLANVLFQVNNMKDEGFISPKIPNEKTSLAKKRTKELRKAHKEKRNLKYPVDIPFPKNEILLDIDNDDDILYGDRDWDSSNYTTNLYGAELDRILGNRVWAIKFANKAPVYASWEGQLLARVNPVLNILKIFLWSFMPELSECVAKDVKENRLTERVVREIVKTCENAEMSSQYRIDIPLHFITKICLYAPNGVDKEGVLIIESKIKPTLYSRSVHETQVSENLWQRNENLCYTIDDLDASEPGRICLGGIVDELMELVAAITATDPHIEPLYSQTTEVLSHTGDGLSVQPSACGESSTDVSNGQGMQKHVRNSDNTLKPQKKQTTEKAVDLPAGHDALHRKRKLILEVLTKYGLITEKQRNEATYNLVNARDGSQVKYSNLLGSLSFDFHDGGCFFDFVNFECKGANHLEEILAQPINAPDFCDYVENSDDDDEDDDEDGDPEEKEDVDFENMPYLTYLKKYAPKYADMYFSLCAKSIMHEDHDSHCSSCHWCNDWHFWHCRNCNQCSYGQSIPTCENCNKKDNWHFDDLPLSVYKENKHALYRYFDDEDCSDNEYDSDDETELRQNYEKDPLCHELPTGDIYRRRYKSDWAKMDIPDLCEDVNSLSVQEDYLHRVGMLGELGIQVGRSVNRTSADEGCMLMRTCHMFDPRDRAFPMMAGIAAGQGDCCLQ